MTWGRLILLSLSITKKKWCHLLVIEPVHYGSSNILLVHFFWDNDYNDYNNYNDYRDSDLVTL